MALCFQIPYCDRYGKHVAIKWGETAQEATALLRKARDIPGLGVADYDTPQMVLPQPFAASTGLDMRPSDRAGQTDFGWDLGGKASPAKASA